MIYSKIVTFFVHIGISLSLFIKILKFYLNFTSSVPSGHWRAAVLSSIVCFSVMMDQNSEICNLSGNDVTIKNTATRVTKSGQSKKSNNCNQCEYASCNAFNLTFDNAQWRKAKQMQSM